MRVVLTTAAFFLELALISAESNYYTAAVYEHVLGDHENTTKKEFIRNNLAAYSVAGRIAASKGADIIVYPEFGIIPGSSTREGIRDVLERIPDPETNRWNPCIQEELNDREILTNLSCLARQTNMVVVANMGDIQSCDTEEDPHCPEDGFYQFNTNVAFDRDGTLLTRYHKIHLYGEYALDVPPVPTNSYFETDFGSFTTFICFDIVFKDAVNAVESLNVSNVAFTSLLNEKNKTAVELMESWALGNKVNVLGANLYFPRIGSVGSGIFSGKYGPLKYTFDSDGKAKLVIAKVPRLPDVPPHNESGEILIIDGSEGVTSYDDGANVPEQCSPTLLGPAVDYLRDYRCPDVNFSNYTLVKLVNTSGKIDACNNGMCCSLEYNSNNLEEDFYLTVFNGTTNALRLFFWCEEVCQLVRCDSVNGKECSTFPKRSKTIFNHVRLTANFSTSYIYPSLVTSTVRAPPLSEWTFERENDSATLVADDLSEPLLSARLHGRCYQRDPPYIRELPTNS